MQWLQSLTCLFFFTSLLITHTLWDRIGRALPSCPVFMLRFELAPYFYPLLLGLFSSCLLLSIVPKVSKYSIGGSLIIWLLFVVLDLNCFQPSFYFFASILALIWFEKLQLLNSYQLLFMIKCIVSATYFWGGLHKINPVYYETIYLWMIQSLSEVMPNGMARNTLLDVGFLTPYLEMMIGIGLLFHRTLKIAAFMAILMHIFIMICLGPWGHNFNYIIFPWNLLLIIFNASFFLVSTENTVKWSFLKNPIISIMLLLNWFLPISNYWGISDSYLSHDLYSGKAYFGFIVLPNESAKKLPFNIKKYLQVYDNNKSYINLTKWSLEELGIPIYPERRVLEYYKHWFEAYTYNPKLVELIIYSQKNHETIH